MSDHTIALAALAFSGIGTLGTLLGLGVAQIRHCLRDKRAQWAAQERDKEQSRRIEAIERRMGLQ